MKPMTGSYPIGQHPEPQGKGPCVWAHPSRPRQRNACFALFFCLLLLFVSPARANAQGCAQCLDGTRATPPQVQAAYRHAIYLLGGTGALLFLVGAFLLRRER